MIKNLKKRLDYHYNQFNSKSIVPDPVLFPHRYLDSRDIEISAFISSIFAYGNLSQIMKTLDEIHKVMQNKPYEFISNFSLHTKIFEKLKYRFYSPDDINLIFYALNKIYSQYDSLKYLFLLYYFENEKNLKSSITFFVDNIKNIIAHKSNISAGIKFMLPDPMKNSACKRMNLFLRWMVRKDNIDFGLWQEIRPDKLVIPVDTHVARVSRMLGLTQKKIVNWQMAEEITENLRRFDPSDPVKYDFAICHIGMNKTKII
ncbi:TIGR02757 family protein [Melioribacter sp. OK-6-Me]|uniref:TIGR02757 family protein n=1 Tax=unclassified Melioribacter TaxID=2627329 RepID=UPI003EDA1465